MAAGGGKEERKALTILWRIENLSYFDKTFFEDDEILSTSFYPDSLKDECTHLSLAPRGKISKGENVYLFLCTDSPFPVDCEFSFLTSNESSFVTRKGMRDTEIEWAFQLKMTDCLTQKDLFVTKKSTFLPHDTLTVRCRVWKSEGNFSQNEFISARSRIEFAEKSILWPVGECSWLNLSKNETFRLRFDFIYGRVPSNLKCSLIGDSQQKLKLNIEFTISALVREYLVKLEVSVLGNEQEVMKLEANKKFLKSSIQQTWVVPTFVLGENLREKMYLSQCGENINILFHLTAVCKDISDCIEKTYVGISNLEHVSARTTSSDANCQTSEQIGDTPIHLRKVSTFSEANCKTSEQSLVTPTDLQRRNDCLGILGEDFFSMYQKQEFSDFELRAGDIAFPVHKVVLSARSPVFHSMFSSEMEESNSKSLDVPDLDAHALNRMLTFMYGGTVEPDLPLQSAANLYYAADKYQVDSLKSLCSSILQSQICVTNVSDILTLADRHQDSDLTSSAHTFVLSHFDDVMDSKEWEKFLDVNPALVGKSMYQLHKKKREKNPKK